MEPEVIERYMEDSHPSWKDGDNLEARAAFIKAMSGRMYGREETRDAWEFFVEGWNEAGKL